ncbi:bis-aminopropyl spermidine synthase family protein [Lederbergia ruris]|uniref:bis-aminopropyl spermidine synthase family protein n=1 Tax=Lederbergia ruris TaxID=217495 RepID=UPI00399FB245
MKYEELNKVLYENFGASSKSAYNILQLAVDQDIQSIHKLVDESGHSFRFVREIIYTLDNDITLMNDHLVISKDLKLLLKNRRIGVELESNSTQGFINIVKSIVENFTQDDADLDHISAVPETCYDRATFLMDNFDIEVCNILFVGDHDLSSITLALLAQHYKLNYNIFVVDIDDNVLSYIQEISNEYGLSIVTSHSDFRYSIPKIYHGKMDVVFTDPPYTPEGISVFINRSLQCMKNNSFSTLIISYKAAEMSNMLGVYVQKEIIKRSLYISQIIPNFNRYYAAEALGYRSDLYLCRLTPATFKYLKNPTYPNKIYTHGTNSVESKSKDIELSDLLDSIDKVTNKKLTEDPIYIIESDRGTNYTGNLKINKMPLRRFIDNTIEGKLNVNKDGLIVFDCAGFSRSYQFRPLLLCGFNEYFCVFTKEQAKALAQNKIVDFIRSGYNIEKITNDTEVNIFHFKQKPKITNNNCKLFLLMLLNVRSGLKNSFVKAITTTFDKTKNEARELFDSLPFKNEQKILLFNLPLHSIVRLSKVLKALHI